MFLLSTRTGGLGDLNLHTADTIIIYDSDWSHCLNLEVQDPTHRIRKKNEVRILRLISLNSVEERLLERAKFKIDLDSKVIRAIERDKELSETNFDLMLRMVLETGEAVENLEQEDMDDDHLNMILARSDEELKAFGQIDEEREKQIPYGAIAGKNRIPCLMTENQLPEIYVSGSNPMFHEME